MNIFRFLIFSIGFLIFGSSHAFVYAQQTGGAVLGLKILLHGIGNGGDNVNPNSPGTTTPLHPERNVTLELYDNTNQLTGSKQAKVFFDETAGNFKGAIDATGIISGVYTMKVKLPHYLNKSIPGIITIAAGQSKELPQVALTTGDSNNDNRLSILDYNLILDCFADLSPAKNCADPAKKIATDLTDDGNVNQFDYNLFLRELSVQGGDGGTPAPTLYLPTPTGSGPHPTNPPGQVKVLCENKTFSNWTSTSPIVIGNTSEDSNPNIVKIIRNCTFKNDQGHGVSKPAIAIQAGDNVLIENSTFDTIRTLVPGDGVHAIYIRGASLAQNIIIRNNSFCDIGADGIQMADGGTQVKNITIEGNDFKNGCHVPSENVAENSVDVKAALGPVYIRKNKIHGFRPCDSPKRGGNQDCSGDPGAGMVIHDDSTGTYPHNVVIEDNEFWDNQIRGLVVSHSYDTIVRNNYFHDHPQLGLEVTNFAVRPQVSNNRFSNNATNCSGVTCP